MLNNTKILILGATGYIGNLLTAKLLSEGYAIRAAGRHVEKLKACEWSKHPRLEIAEVDVLNPASLEKVCSGCEAVYYLVHSMNSEQKDFVEADRRAANNMIQAAEKTQMKRIIYLGGLGEDDGHLSKHLRSRNEVLQILHSGKIPATSFRAAMIIGKGSISFEILRRLVNRLPIMITPRWVMTESQPIAVENVIYYLSSCLKHEETQGQTFDIGGPDIVSYRQLMDIYAQEAGIYKRFIIPIPFLTPTLSSYWVQLVTHYPAYIAKPLAQGLRNRVVCKENRIREIIPQTLLNCHQAIRKAI